MKAPFSSYLAGIEQPLQQLIDILSKEYEYVSALATDSPALAAVVRRGTQSVTTNSLTAERGIVIRVMNDGHYREYALNTFDPSDVEGTAKRIVSSLAAQDAILSKTAASIYATGAIPDEPDEIFYESEVQQLPEEADLDGLLGKLNGLYAQVKEENPDLLNFMLSVSSTHINKMFLSKHKHLKQSYVIAEVYAISVGMADGRVIPSYSADSGLCGLEIVDRLPQLAKQSLAKLADLKKAEPIAPGEYDVIANPEVAGVIAHEAFGHGMEMDMFVKNRALAREKMGEKIASSLVTMHEGALCAQNVTSYAFDDEGTRAGDVIEIDHGILRNGICDALSAVRLGIQPTGNGKRQNFEHKVYTRMTNTLFDSGDSTLAEMISSISYGYLLEGISSGMEDPKHWGIQCILTLGREIRDGKLTGKVVSPIIMTGYVPDLLNSISMVSNDRGVYGSGYCGKGYKEFVKVSDGGPYLKMKARLG